MNPAFWNGRRVLVTGHTGFKGSWMCLWLRDLGAEVSGYALKPPTSPALFDELDLGRMIKSRTGDIRDADHLREFMLESRPEIVIHLAAQSLVFRSFVDPLETYMTNVMGTAHVLEAVRHCECVKAVVNVTSDKCYRNHDCGHEYREEEALGGSDPYSSSKACSELVTESYQHSFFTAESGVRLASARAGNVVGGGDWADNRLVPDIISAFLGKRPAVIRNPEAVRPWQHVLEPIAGYLVLAEKLYSREGRNYVGAYNFGPVDGNVRPVSWIADGLCARWGSGASWVPQGSGNQYPVEVRILRLDSGKAQAVLGWGSQGLSWKRPWTG